MNEQLTDDQLAAYEESMAGDDYSNKAPAKPNTSGRPRNACSDCSRHTRSR